MPNNKETIHILVAENLPIVRDGLISVLEHLVSVHIHVVAVSNLHSLNNLLAAREFNFLFISPRFDDGFVLADFQQRHPQIPCVAILNDLALLSQCDNYYGFITAFDSSEKILHLIESYKNVTTTPVTPSDETDLLSSREKEILVLLAKGFSNKEVADQLFLSVYTVMTHRRNICSKLKIRSVSGLTIYAIANKLLDM